jgi:hypothetical protein
MFTKGTRVQVVSKKLCNSWCAYLVEAGMKGTCTTDQHSNNDDVDSVAVNIDEIHLEYFLPVAALKRLHVKKVQV